jgi:hypothetical protein
MRLTTRTGSRTAESPARNPAARTRLGVQQLEAREVPAVDLLSALAVGSDTGPSQVLDVAADAAGNSYLAGYFSGTADFDPGPSTYPLTARGGTDAYVAKYAPNPDGTLRLVWARRLGGDATVSRSVDDDWAHAVAVDGGGNVLVAGRFNGTGDFGGVTLTSAGGQDAFVAKLDPNGQVLWARRWGAANNDEAGFGVGADAAGNVYALGDRHGPTLANNGDDVLKFSPAGSLLWTRSVNITGIPGRAVADGDLAVDAAGNVYVADTFNGTVNFNPEKGKPQNVSSAENKGFVLKLTSAGAFAWVSTFRGASSGFDLSRQLNVAVDGTGGVSVGGWYDGTVDFDPGPGTYTLPAGNGTGFVVRLTASTGAFVWAQALTTPVLGLTADAAGNVYATGGSRPVVKLNADGSFGWVETIGGGSCYAVAVDPSGTIHLAGFFSGTVDFDPDPLGTYELTTPGPYTSSFLVRLRPS